MKTVSVLMTVLYVALAASAQSIPLDSASQVFDAAKRVNARDGGKLWGMQVCGPLFVVDPDSHAVVANQADARGELKRDGDVWTGTLPKEITPANSATEWNRTKWTMLMWPVTSDTRDRERLVGHECFHRIQDELKLPARDAVAGHLDGKDGRIWLQLEWRALERALATSGEQRRTALADALLFRGYRRALLKNAYAVENQLEMNEGLAEYTGFRLATDNEADRRAAAIAALHNGPGKKSFGRSFAYVSGPAYGLLLDPADANWRKKLTPSTDIGALLGAAYRIPPAKTDSASAMAAARSYEGDILIAAENIRAKELEAKLAEMRKKFVDGPVLVLPVDSEFGYGFNPNDVTSLDENSTIYGWARITGTWGVLETSNGALMIRDGGKIVKVVVPATKSVESATSDDWKLELKPGWKIVAGTRSGDQTLAKQ